MKSKINCYNNFFSHIYIEKDILEHENTKEILKKFEKSEILLIDNYLEVFSRGQSFYYQKKSQKLILAKRRENSIYKGAEVCEDFGNENFFYTSMLMNCVYDCEYCYLQGMYHSANIVFFVNIEDVFAELSEILKKESVYLCVSYDTDILAFEKIFPLTRKWIEFAKTHANLKIEIRTKSSNFHLLEDMSYVPNVIFAWTISPEYIAHNFEHKTPDFKLRIEDMKKAVRAGYKIRICIDPVIHIKDFKNHYGEFIESIFRDLKNDDILDISIGLFRVNKDYLKRMKKQRFESYILNYPFEGKNNICSYNAEHSKIMMDFIYNKLCEFVDCKKIFV